MAVNLPPTRWSIHVSRETATLSIADADFVVGARRRIAPIDMPSR